MPERPTRRIVVTGLGLVTPLGTGVEKTWKALCAGQSGIGRITKFDPAAYDAQIAGEVKDFDPAQFIEKKEIKKMDTFIHYAVGAAQLAVDDAALKVAPKRPRRSACTSAPASAGWVPSKTITTSSRKKGRGGCRPSSFR